MTAHAEMRGAPNLYLSSAIETMARTEGIVDIRPHTTSIKTITEHGSRGVLLGRPVRNLILHESNDVSASSLTVRRLLPGQTDPTALTFAEAPAVHPQQIIERGLPHRHSLVVPIEDFDELSAAWALHEAAAQYGQGLSNQPRDEELRAPDSMFGNPTLDTLTKGAALLLGGIVSRGQSKDRRERPEDLADKMVKGIAPIIGRGKELVEMAQTQSMPDTPTHPLTPAEMAALVEQAAPLSFHYIQ